ncbi:pyridoxal 5'-phosphate synthase [Streptomyces sp. NPDC059740]|uniref:pyridoxine/pyridoxamine 5'-phosphate oxidase n=1 Tax=Streptomyces sp. NPDC059740 TaxID=3346926 RepID=UPI00364CDBC1
MTEHTPRATGPEHDNPSPAPARSTAGQERPVCDVGVLARRLPVWEHPLPDFDPDGAPDEPVALFREWFRHAAEAGVPEPQSMTLATAGADGEPDARVVVLHEADEAGWHFASHRDSAKGRDLAERPHAALCFYWPRVGRQVRVRGPVATASEQASSADLHRRSPGALAAALVGRQSRPLGSAGELARASQDAWEQAHRDPGAPVPRWTLYTLRPAEVEFFQGDARYRRHVRLLYRRSPKGWRRGLLWP